MNDEPKKAKDVNINLSPVQLNLTEPATVFLNRVSDAIGGLAKPWQIKRVAQAESEAAVTKATADIQIDDLRRRALIRFANEQANQQITMESIAAKAAPLITEQAKPEQVSPDWITDFFRKCRNVSDEDMQALWARVLAGEANLPGTYSRRTLAVLESLDKEEAETFARLCRFNWYTPIGNPIITDFAHPFYQKNNINFGMLNWLAATGLLTLNEIGCYNANAGIEEVWVRYGKESFLLRSLAGSKSQLPLGQVFLTLAGFQLASIISAEPVPEFKQHVLGFWVTRGWIVHEVREVPQPPAPNPVQAASVEAVSAEKPSDSFWL